MRTNQIVADVLDTSADVLINDGWIQDFFERYGKRCALGAIDQAICNMGYKDSGLYPHLYREAKAALQSVIGPYAISGWNDEPGRTVDEVLQAFLDAAIKVRPDAEIN